MQSNHLILGSSLLALVLCALPYGCAGKSTEIPSDTSSGGKSCNCADGSAPPQPDGNTYSDGSGFVNHGDGGLNHTDGTQFGGDGDHLGMQADGSPDGWDADGDPNSDGTPGDGWDAHGDGQSDGAG